jgi:hypothetical protein
MATDINQASSFSLSTLAREFSTTRETLRKRLTAAKVKPSGTSRGFPLYRLRDALQAWMGTVESGFDPDALDPFKRRAYYQSEHEKLRLQVERRELIPRLESEQEMASLVKVVAECFDTLPDVLERDCGLNPNTLVQLECSLDKAREQLYQRLTADDDDSELEVTTL